MNEQNNTNGTQTYKRKSFDELTFTDDFMFHAVLRDNEPLCKRLVEILLDVDVDHIDLKGDDYTLSNSTESRSIRMDVYLKGDGKVYDIEMQNRNKGFLPKRIRYYQSMIDVSHLDSGAEYTELPDSCIVFICTFDPFKDGIHKYEFTDMCRQIPGKELGTGAEKVFINAKGRRENMSQEMQDFLDYLCDNIPRSDFTKEIELTIAKVKDNRVKRGEYMVHEIWRVDERREGREEGRAEGRDEIVRIVDYLMDQDRYDDLKMATKDESFRQKILDEMADRT